jgi:hypothetical protein
MFSKVFDQSGKTVRLVFFKILFIDKYKIEMDFLLRLITAVQITPFEKNIIENITYLD